MTATPEIHNYDVATTILRKTPGHAFTAHPRYWPRDESAPTPAMLLGSVVHKLVLGAGAKIVVIEYPDFKTVTARDARDAAIAAGKIPCLTDDFDRDDKVAERVSQGLDQIMGGREMFPGAPEIVAIWREGDVWRCAMFGGRVAGGRYFVIDDLKTSGDDIGPDAIGKKFASLGYEVQAALYLRGLAKVAAVTRAVFKFAFVIRQNRSKSS